MMVKSEWCRWDSVLAIRINGKCQKSGSASYLWSNSTSRRPPWQYDTSMKYPMSSFSKPYLLKLELVWWMILQIDSFHNGQLDGGSTNWTQWDYCHHFASQKSFRIKINCFFVSFGVNVNICFALLICFPTY